MYQFIINKITSYFDIINKKPDNIDNIIKLIFSKKIIENSHDNFISQINIFNNKQDIIKNLQSVLKKNSIKYILTEILFVRVQYYSQICDRLEKVDNIYTEDLMFIDKLSYKNIDIFLFNSEKIQQNILSFPNLQQYHYSIKINAIHIIIDNITIIFENNNIFIEIKKELNKNIFELIFNILFI
jgi:hypothetical protein